MGAAIRDDLLNRDGSHENIHLFHTRQERRAASLTGPREVAPFSITNEPSPRRRSMKNTESDVEPGEKEAMKPAGNVIDLLKKDHRTVSALFKQFEEADEEEEEQKVALAQQICLELSVHAEVEERIFYPAAREALEGEAEDLIDEAAVEHRSLKMLIAEIDGSSPDDQLFAANVKVLKEYVEHHVKEEEREIFPRLEGDKLDLEAMGAQIAEMKMELLEKIGEPKPPRAGAKATVHVPALPGHDGSGTKAKSSKSAGSGSKSTAAKGKTTSRAAANGKAGSRSSSHSAHR
jgi:hemerythrin-like domain-containing protein